MSTMKTIRYWSSTKKALLSSTVPPPPSSCQVHLIHSNTVRHRPGMFVYSN